MLAELIVLLFVISLIFSAYITTKEYFLDDSDIDYKKYSKEPKVDKDYRNNELNLSPKEFKKQMNHYSDYKSYLGSKKWKKIKRRRYIYDRGICQHCKKKVYEFSYHTSSLNLQKTIQ